MFSWLKKDKGLTLKERLNSVKKLKINGMKFVIKKVNPLLDLPADKIPQIFTDYSFHKNLSNPTDINYQKKMLQSMYAYIEAGVIDPKLVPIGIGDKHGKEPGITAEDLFRDPTIGTKLYLEIIDYSMNSFRGLKGLFFDKEKALIVHYLADKYGQRPSDIVFTESELSIMEKQAFDIFVYQVGIKEEMRQMQRMKTKRR